VSNLQTDFLAESAAYMAARKIAESTFGRLAVNDSNFLERVRAGNVTLRTIEKAREFMRSNPAADPTMAADKPRRGRAA
jgi:hypothetical protein